MLYAAATGGLEEHPSLKWRDEAAVNVVLAASGYPEAPIVGDPITGVSTVTEVTHATVYQAGTKLHDNVLCSNGGRVLSVTGIGADLAEARSAAYEAISRIGLAGSHYRSDIALAASTTEKIREN